MNKIASTQHDSSICIGNAHSDSVETRGWFVGSFLSKEFGLRHSNDVEIKWGDHTVGARRQEWVTGEVRTAVAVLISGEFVMEFRDRTVTLSKPGDYVMWGPGVDHRWHVDQKATIITIRWPSIKK